MPSLKYLGPYDSRTLYAKDFRRLGVEDQNKVVWDSENNRTAEVTDDAADKLLADESLGKFEIAYNPFARDNDADNNDEEDASSE